MVIIKENLWNRIFKSAQIEAQEKELFMSNLKVVNSEDFISKIKDCNSLIGLLDIHKKAWMKGFHNKNLGPDWFGMFRTDDIAYMRPDEVFLGNINGLWTFSITEWEKKKGTDDYNIVLKQYKSILLGNIVSITRDAKEYLRQFYQVNPS